MDLSNCSEHVSNHFWAGASFPDPFINSETDGSKRMLVIPLNRVSLNREKFCSCSDISSVSCGAYTVDARSSTAAEKAEESSASWSRRGLTWTCVGSVWKGAERTRLMMYL